MIHEYKTGRSVCGFVEFCAWAGVVIAAIMVLAAFGASSRGGSYTLALAGVVPALTVLIFCFILVVLTQMARACMDGSVAAQKNVIEAKKHHDEMLRALRSYATRSPATEAAPQPSLAQAAQHVQKDQPVGRPAHGAVTTTAVQKPGVIEHSGHKIVPDGDRYRVHGIGFADLEKAKAHIDSIAVKPEPEPVERREPVVAIPKGLS